LNLASVVGMFVDRTQHVNTNSKDLKTYLSTRKCSYKKIVMHINDLFQIDFGDKPDEWIYSIGLDNDHADAIFLRQISTKAESASIKNKIFLLSEKLTDAFCQVTVERSGTARLFFSNT
jgi:hypothetical protein